MRNVIITFPPPLTTPVPLTRRASFGEPNNDGSQPDGTDALRFQLALRFLFWYKSLNVAASDYSGAGYLHSLDR
jgi:hypothetical protein